MSRTVSKYWDKARGGEDPVVHTAKSAVGVEKVQIRTYPKAGVVQFYNVLNRGDNGGAISKGVSLHMDECTQEELIRLKQFLNTTLDTELAVRQKKGVTPTTRPNSNSALVRSTTFEEAMKA